MDSPQETKNQAKDQGKEESCTKGRWIYTPKDQVTNESIAQQKTEARTNLTIISLLLTNSC